MTRRTLATVVAVVAVFALARQASAQGANAMVEGTVKNAKGDIVAGATVTFKSTDGIRSASTKSNNKGQFTQIGLYPTEWEITAKSNDQESLPTKMTLPPAVMSRVDLTLNDKKVIAAAAASGTDSAKAQQAAKDKIAKLFGEGETAANAGDYDTAIAKFTEGLAMQPLCASCYGNLGVAYLNKKDYDNAEKNFKKAVEMNPNDADSYNGLSNVYNAQKKFELAAEASGKAAAIVPPAAPGAIGSTGGGGNPDALYAQAANLFNAGKSPEAKALLEQVVKAKPDHADAHYLLGLIVSADDPKTAKTEIETYLKLSPNGSNAATAKAVLAELQKIVK